MTISCGQFLYNVLITFSYFPKKSSLKFPAWVPIFWEDVFLSFCENVFPDSPNTHSKCPIYRVVGLFIGWMGMFTFSHFCASQLQIFLVFSIAMYFESWAMVPHFLFPRKSSWVIHWFKILKLIFYPPSKKKIKVVFIFFQEKFIRHGFKLLLSFNHFIKEWAVFFFSAISSFFFLVKVHLSLIHSISELFFFSSQKTAFHSCNKFSPQLYP